MSSLALDRRRWLGEDARGRRLHSVDGARREGGARNGLIEREAELDAFDAALRRLHSGRGTVIVLDAGAGLGKSALLEDTRGLASSTGCAVRRAAPGPLERSLPFGVIRTLLEPALRERSEEEHGELLDGPAQLAGALLDGWAPDGDATMVLAHSVLWLCVRLARERPLVLLLDDAQWSDLESLRVLSYVARRLDDLPLLLAVAARGDEAGAPTASLSELTTLGSATLLRLRPLTPMGAVRLIRRLAPETPTQVCCECHRAAAGSPWLVGELARQLAEDPAPEVTEYGRTIVRRRMAQLDPPSRAVAAALSVIGADAPAPALAAVAGVALEALGAACDSLRSAGLLANDDDRFAHRLIGASIRDDLAGTERERLHREAARALIGSGASAEVVASHLLRCRSRSDPAASEVLRRAAAAAVVRGAPEDAATFLERALEEHASGDERGRMLAQLATVTFDAGLPGSRRRLQEALSEVADHATRVDVLTRLAALGVVDGSGAFAGHEIEQLDAGGGDRDAQLAAEAAALDMLLTMPYRSAERRRRVGAAVRLTASADPLLRRVVVAHRAWLAGELGSSDAGACAELALEALDGGLLLAAAGQRPAYHLCTRVLVMTDRTEEARVAIDALREHATATGSLRLRAAALWYASDLALRTGRVIDAERHARSALATVQGDVNVFTAGAVTVLAAALGEQGKLSEAREVLDASAPECSGYARSWDPAVRHARARLSLHERDFERAYEDAFEAGRGREQQGRPNPAWTPWRSTAALALAHLGRRSEAARLADGELALAERFGAPRAIARALHARAVAEPGDDARVALCERGLAVLARTDAVLESVRLRLELGATLAYVGRRIQARDALRPALAEADAVGATLLAQRARRELVATGLRPRRAAVDGVAALTPRQRQVCEHAASGMSNMAIAHALFLSIKTVETHLAAGYRKLGVNRRRELAAKLAQSAPQAYGI